MSLLSIPYIVILYMTSPFRKENLTRINPRQLWTYPPVLETPENAFPLSELMLPANAIWDDSENPEVLLAWSRLNRNSLRRRLRKSMNRMDALLREFRDVVNDLLELDRDFESEEVKS